MAQSLLELEAVQQWGEFSLNQPQLYWMAELHDLWKASIPYLPNFFGNLFEQLTEYNSQIKPDSPIVDSINSREGVDYQEMTWRQLWDMHSQLTYNLLEEANEPRLADAAAGHHFLSWCARGTSFTGYCPEVSSDEMILLECADFIAAAIHREPRQSPQQACEILLTQINRLIANFAHHDEGLLSHDAQTQLDHQTVQERLQHYQQLADILWVHAQHLEHEGGHTPTRGQSARTGQASH